MMGLSESRYASCMVVLALTLVALSATFVPSVANASDGLSSGSVEADSAASAETVVSTQASASRSCALLRKDGNLWRCTAKGKPVSKFWNGNKGLVDQLNKVRTVFIASDAPSVASNSYAWTRYTYSSGKKSDSRYSIRFSGSFLKNVVTVKFLVNSSGASKCKLIGDYAFSYADNIRKVVNLDKTKVTQIGERAFTETSITRLSFPKTLKTIGKSAFNKCEGLTTVIGLKKTRISSLGNYAYYYCPSLKSVSLPNACKTIGDYAFGYCTGLKSVSLGSGVSAIGASAFYNCEQLPAVSLPASCKKLGSSAFSGCSALKKVTMRSKSVVEHASGGTYSMASQFYGTPVAEDGSDAYFYVPESLLEEYSSDDYSNPWHLYGTKFRAI